MIISFLKVARDATPGNAAITLLTSRPAPGKRSISVAFNVFSELGDSDLETNCLAVITISSLFKTRSSSSNSKVTVRELVTVISFIICSL